MKTLRVSEGIVPQEFLEAVAQGLADAVAGRVVEHAKVEQWLTQWGTENEGEPPL